MKMNLCACALFIIGLFTSSCEKIDHEAAKAPDRDHKLKIQRIVDNTKSFKTLNPFDVKGGFHYQQTGHMPGKASLTYDLASSHKVGINAFSLKYEFTGTEGETVFFEQIEKDWRSDLSYHPLGISLWIKGNKENKGVFRFILMEDEKMFIEGKPYDPSRRRWQYYAYENSEILKKEGWNRLIIPYDEFELYKKGSGIRSTEPTMNRYAGYRIEITNNDGSVSKGEISIDELRHLSSFDLQPNNAKFSSMFIQLNTPFYDDADWDQEFKDSKEIGVDTWIIQYAQKFSGESVSFYKNTELPWVEVKLDYIDKMFEAAERQGMKLILGLYPGDFNVAGSPSNSSLYAKYQDRTKKVFDELNTQFGDNPCLEGWYITQEFHDGTWPSGGWLQNPAKSMLAAYLQNVASYIKSKSDKSTQIAPALWRGMPADKTGKWFEELFEKTPDIDFLYLQDCGGRGSGGYYLTDVDVDLPNWFAEIKKACDKTGVKFGVDIESFQPDYKAKPWAELHDQLWVAGMYTEYITNFSWQTFKKGTDGYEGYKKYLEENDLLGKK